MLLRSTARALAISLLSVPVLAQATRTATPATSRAPAGAATAAAPRLTDPLPVDPKVRIGTLPNGLRYYVRQNPKPEKRAELRLVVNAGSILEDEDQRGMAHFVEHTAFNGTTHFKKNDLISYLQSIGVRFGADLNAETGFDETVYILPVPTDTARILESGFQILEDWAHGQLFDSTEVANERGVVVEEWRGGRGADERMMQQWLPVAFKGSRYATRLPIGTQESILAATPGKLRRFYQDWYRPDLMAVIAVGDFDPARIEALIRQHFSKLAGPAKERPRALADVPNNKEPLIAVATDKEATSSNVGVYFKRPRTPEKTVGDYRRALAERLYLGMLNSRFDEIAQKPDAPFLGAGASKQDFFARTTEAFVLGAGVKDGEIDRGLEAILTEARRVDQFGFLQSELDREKQDVLRAYERAYAERDKTNSSAYVGEYVDNYLTGDAIPGITYEYDLTKRLLPTITLAEVNALARAWITDENRVVIAEAPDKPGVKVPTQAELVAVFDRAAKAPVTAYTENLSGSALVERMPTAGKVVSERRLPAVNVTEWRLSNGARVLFKPTDFKADEILFTAYSPGGLGLASDSNFMSAQLATQVAALGGLGQFNQIDLQKKLAGKVASAGPSIGETSEGLGGRASPKDLETMFQLIYLRFTAPRLDTAAFAAFRNQVTPYLTNRGSSPDAVFEDTVQVTMAQHHFRARPFTLATFAEVDPAKAMAFYKDRFADAGDFTFVFVGNIVPDSLRPLVERYLASLPTAGRKESWKDMGIVPPKGVVERVVKKGVEPKANTLILFTGPFHYAPETRVALRGLTDLFQIMLDRTLREQLGGTYSPSVGGGGSRIPREEYTIQVQYNSAPDNVDKLARTVFALIDSLKTNGPAAADVEKVKEQILREREVQLKKNDYWLSSIAQRDQNGEDIAGILTYDDLVKQLTPERIREAARTYFDTKNYAKFVLLPEK